VQVTEECEAGARAELGPQAGNFKRAGTEELETGLDMIVGAIGATR
jgi:hypothetical protein